MSKIPDPGLIEETNARLQRRPQPPFRSIRKDLRLSLEFFPPATSAGAEGVMQSIREMESLAPDFVSVTYGAGGSSQERSLDLVRRVQTETRLKTAAHLTCVGASKHEIQAVVERFAEAGRFFLKHADHGYSFTDVTSIVIMRELSLRQAFTHDRHFSEAGFEILLP